MRSSCERGGTSADGPDGRSRGRCYDRAPVATLVRALRDRLVPAVLTAAGVTLIAAGLLNYSGNAAAADPAASETPVVVSADPSIGIDLPSLPPVDGSPPPSVAPSATPNPHRVATRVVVEQLGIDLPIIKPR